MKHWYKIYIFTVILISLGFIGFNIIAQIGTEQNLKNFLVSENCPNFPDTDKNEMTAKDACTGIVWARTELPVYKTLNDATPGYTWNEANLACSALAPAGTFRLAKTEELLSLMSKGCAGNNCNMTLGAPGHLCNPSFANGVFWASNEFNEPVTWSNYARSVNLFTGKADTPVFGKNMRLNAWCVVSNPPEVFEQKFIDVTKGTVANGITITGATKVTAYNRECNIDDDCQTTQTAGSTCSIQNNHCTKSNSVTLSRIYSCNTGYYINGNSCSPVTDLIGTTMCGSCSHKTCAQLGKNCGMQDDSCGTQINCGTCTSPATCYNGNCCTPQTCAQLGKNCGGPYGDNCGGSITNCGTCAVGTSCSNGTCCTNPVCTVGNITCAGTSPAIISTCNASDDTHPCPWTSTIPCQAGQVCSGNSCSCPATQCTVGVLSCKDTTTKQTCTAAGGSHPCNYQLEEACPTEQTCSGAGVCSCPTPQCTVGTVSCKDTTTKQTCTVANPPTHNCNYQLEAACEAGKTCSGAGVCAFPGTPITITNTSTTALTDYQVKFTLSYTGTIPTQLNIIDQSGTKIPYYIDTTVTTNPRPVYVKVPSIPAKVGTTNGTATIYVAKPITGSLASNGGTTFDLFQDFSVSYGTLTLLGGETDCGSYSCWGDDGYGYPCNANVSRDGGINAGYIAGATSGYIPSSPFHAFNCADRQIIALGFKSAETFSDNFRVTSKIKVPNGNSYTTWYAVLGLGKTYLALYNGGANVGWYGGGSWTNLGATSINFTTYRSSFIKIDETFNNGIVKLFVNDVKKGEKNWTAGSYPNQLHFGFSPNASVSGFDAYVDDLRVTKYVEPEPTLSPTSVTYSALP